MSPNLPGIEAKDFAKFRGREAETWGTQRSICGAMSSQLSVWAPGRGQVIMVRYADDFVVGFEKEQEH